MNTMRNRRSRRAWLAALLPALLAGAGGCQSQSAGEGAVKGGALGALGGLAIGSLTGDAGTGAAIGAIGGAVAGGVIGEENRKAEARQQEIRYGDDADDGKKEQMMRTFSNRVLLNTARCIGGLAVAVLFAGCSGTPKSASSDVMATRPAEVSPLRTTGLEPLDRSRVALGRFVGAWDFEGWYDPPGESRRQTAGIAAGTVEHRHFLLIDIGRIVQQDQKNEFATGSMLLSVEPGPGLMLTTWAEGSPAVHRFRGRVEAEGSQFTFEQVTGLRSDDPLRMIMRFETDDRWVAQFYRPGSDVIAASYTFTRAG